jgi:hypothetical protein
MKAQVCGFTVKLHTCAFIPSTVKPHTCAFIPSATMSQSSHSLTLFSPVVKLLNKIGRDKVLPEALKPFLKHAIDLLNEHNDNLLIRPAEDYTQQRMDIVRNLLRSTVVPMAETSVALQCPLSEEVLKSLVLACAVEHENIVKGLSCNRVLTDARPHLQHLYLLYDALRLPDVERSYFGALQEMVRQAEERRDMALQALQNRSFQQVCKPISGLGHFHHAH